MMMLDSGKVAFRLLERSHAHILQLKDEQLVLLVDLRLDYRTNVELFYFEVCKLATSRHVYESRVGVVALRGIISIAIVIGITDPLPVPTSAMRNSLPSLLFTNCSSGILG